VARQIWAKPDSVLGLATGGTPVGMYANLADMHRRNDLDFSKVKTFNLDEYYPIPKENRQSYDYFMWDNLFSHINIPKENVHIPNGEAPDAAAECARYDRLLAEAGGIDLQVLGIGTNGHIGFNEPGDSLRLSAHKVSLAPSTIQANARFFKDAADVPRHALTAGMATIMKARKIIIMISGKNKSAPLKRLLDGKITTDCPATMLNMHSDVIVIADKDAMGLND